MNKRIEQQARGMAFAFALATALQACGPSTTDRTQPATSKDLFIDATEVSGARLTHFNGMRGEYYLAEITGAGVALLDYDNDGKLDILALQGTPLGPGELPNAPKEPCTSRLFHNDLVVDADGLRNLRFTDVTEASGLCANGYGMGITVGDIDNDGCVDVFVTHYRGPNQLFRNQCDGKFVDITHKAAVAGRGDWGMSGSFFDYDRDGFLDLYVTNYVDFDIARNKHCSNSRGARDWCTPAVYPNVPGILYHNRGDGTFEDVSRRSGITATFGAGMGVVTADFNDDGWPDVYVANDMNPNQLWINQKNGTFRDEAVIRGCAVNINGAPESSMGVDLADYNNDGSEDLIITHITREKATLFVNLGQGQFEDRSMSAGLFAPTTPYTGFGTAFIDYDNDGWLDLVIANGSVVRQDVSEEDPFPLRQPKQLLRNLGNGRFVETTKEAGRSFAMSEVGRGLAAGDIDNDGAIDFVISNNNGPMRVIMSNGSMRPWLGLRLMTGKRDAHGARVEVKRKEAPTLFRRARADGSYLSARDPRVLIGLGSASSIEKVTVHWPNGFTEQFPVPSLGKYTTLVEGTGSKEDAK